MVTNMKPLILLHGAIGAKDQLQPLADKLSECYQVYTFSFFGHGGVAPADEPISIDLFSRQLKDFINENHLTDISVFGYSMGGYVALYLSRQFPGLIKKVVNMATKFEWNEAIAAKEVQMLNPEKIEMKVPAFAKTLEIRHAPNSWKQLLLNTAEMLRAMGQANPLKLSDYQAITIPVLVMLGDRDKMVGLDETLTTYYAIPNSQFAVLPNTQHPIEQVDLNLLSHLIGAFIG